MGGMEDIDTLGMRMRDLEVTISLLAITHNVTATSDWHKQDGDDGWKLGYTPDVHDTNVNTTDSGI